MNPPLHNTGNGPHGIAPYNFVALPPKVSEPTETATEIDHARFGKDLKSGWLGLTLETVTPLYIRAGVRRCQLPDENKLQEAVWSQHDRNETGYRDFFHHGDPQRPVIPGSELRGMIRELVTIMSDSALRTAQDKLPLYRDLAGGHRRGKQYRIRFTGANTRNGGQPFPGGRHQDLAYPVRTANPLDPNRPTGVRGGYLFKDDQGWYILPAQAQHGDVTIVRVTPDQLTNAGIPQVPNSVTAIWVDVPAPALHDHRDLSLELSLATRVSACCASALQKVWLVVTAPVGRPQKHYHCAVLAPVNNATPVDIDRKLQQRFEDDAKGDNGRSLCPEKRDRNSTDPLQEQNLVPCFYLLDSAGGVVGFGPTLFFRIPTRRVPSDLVPTPPKADFATGLFGPLLGFGSDAEPAASRIAFDDLHLPDKQNGFPGLEEFNDERFYCTTKEALLSPKPQAVQMYLVQPDANLRTYDDQLSNTATQPNSPASEAGTALRGFKLYWHRQFDAGDLLSAAGADDNFRNTHTVMRPVRAGVVFEGRVRFDNLTGAELGALLCALQLEGTKRHKLGMGRPLGLGSVRLEVKSLHLTDPDSRYKGFFSETDDQDKKAFRLDCSEEPEKRRTVLAAIFHKHMLGHREVGGVPENDPEQWHEMYWSDSRMMDLAEMLEWDGKPDRAVTRYVPHNLGHNHLLAQHWRGRWILPGPAPPA